MRGNGKVKWAVHNAVHDPLFVACREHNPQIAEWTVLWYRMKDRMKDRYAPYDMAVAWEVLECRASPDTVGMFIEEVYAALGGPAGP